LALLKSYETLKTGFFHLKLFSLNKKAAQIIVHIAAWGCFLMLPLIFYPRPLDSSFIPEQAVTPFFFISNFFYIGFYYFNTHVLFSKLLEKNKIFFYFLIIVGIMIFFGSMPRLYQSFFGHFQRFSTSIPVVHPFRNYHPPILSPGSISIFLLVFLFSTGVKVMQKWMNSERRNKQIENEKLHAELSFLKSQINPHFLFNTLNNIYSLAENKSDLTPVAVMKLSNIMRYVLTEARQDTVSLEKEMQFINDYIELQKIRSTDKTSVGFTVVGDISGKKISPMILLPFTENAFKYGVSTRELSPINILVESHPDHIHFKIRNNKHNNGKKSLVNTGIGINNTRRRLELLYPGKYELNIEDEPFTYTINLNIHS
jgi:two-component system LytT family sensor kinase